MISSDPPGAIVQEQTFPCINTYSTPKLSSGGHPYWEHSYSYDYSNPVIQNTGMVTPAYVSPSDGKSGLHVAWRVVWSDGTESEWRKEESYHFIKSSYSKRLEDKPSFTPNNNRFSDNKPVSDRSK